MKSKLKTKRNGVCWVDTLCAVLSYWRLFKFSANCTKPRFALSLTSWFLKQRFVFLCGWLVASSFLKGFVLLRQPNIQQVTLQVKSVRTEVNCKVWRLWSLKVVQFAWLKLSRHHKTVNTTYWGSWSLKQDHCCWTQSSEKRKDSSWVEFATVALTRLGLD